GIHSIMIPVLINIHIHMHWHTTNQNPHVHPGPHHLNHVPVYHRPSYYRRTVRLLQAALQIGQRPLPLLGTPKANTDVRDRLTQMASHICQETHIVKIQVIQ
ncbi:hypothetical protein MKX01_016822, partial [Papaver californicum]